MESRRKRGASDIKNFTEETIGLWLQFQRRLLIMLIVAIRPADYGGSAYGSKTGIVPGVQGGRGDRQHLGGGKEFVYFPIGGEPIKQLETALQARLFARSPRGVTLTGEGQMLYQYVRNALGLLATGEDKLSQAQQLLLGTLTIGASDTVTGQFLTPYLDEFHHQHPGIRLKIVSGRSAKVVSMLRSGAVDIAFASSPKDSTLETWPCFTTHSVFVAGKNYHCDFDKIYTRQEMAEFPLILLERKASSRVFLEQEFLKAGVTLTPEIELSSRQLLVTLAGIGLGVAGVTLEFVRKDLESGDIRLLKTDFTIPERSVDMCTLKEVPPTAAATAFMEMVRRGM